MVPCKWQSDLHSSAPAYTTHGTSALAIRREEWTTGGDEHRNPPGKYPATLGALPSGISNSNLVF